MMKMNSKKIIISLIVFVVAGLLISGVIWAKGQTNPTSTQAQLKNFCERLPQILSKIDQRLTEKQSRLQEIRNEHWQNIAEQRNERNERLAENRQRWDENRAAHFEKILDKAKDDEQKQTVLAFHQAVAEAISQRRQTVDQAIREFRQDFDEALASRQLLVDQKINEFLEASRSALEQAQTDCNNGLEPRTIWQNLRDELKAARQKLNQDRQEITKLNDLIKPLTETKQGKMHQAVEAFQTTLQTAKDELKELLGL